MLRQVCAAMMLATWVWAAEDPLVFAFFRKNGEDGLYLATSEDGLRWAALHQDKPLLQPMVGESKLMRDPSIWRDEGGVFHMVWTTSWQGATIGYAHSRDLKNWSEQRAIMPWQNQQGLQNCWAPELFQDGKTKEFWIVWASTIAGRFPETQGQGSRDNNHRLYAMRTRDFQTFSQPELFYDPGFLVIDGAVFRDGKRYAMVVKNETQTPPAKYLFLTFADGLSGPWSKPSAPISGVEWAEGPSPVRIGGMWYVYFDRYRKHQYGVVRSRDLQRWEDVSEQLAMPVGVRHGTVFRAPRKVVEGLR